MHAARSVEFVRVLALVALPFGCSPRNVAAPTVASEAGSDVAPEAALSEAAVAESAAAETVAAGSSCRLLPPAGLTANGVVQPMEIVIPCAAAGVCMQGSFAPSCHAGAVPGSTPCGSIACANPCTCESAASGTCRCPWAGPMPGPLTPPDLA